MTRLLIEAGCIGEDGASQRWDTLLPKNESPIVWRRSFPHGGRWPDVAEMVQKLDGYIVRAVVMVRDWHPAGQSQKTVGHVPTVEQAVENLRRAALDIPRQCHEAGVPFVQVTYAGLVARPDVVLEWLMAYLGLSVPDHDIYDGDEKWWSDMDKYILKKGEETIEVLAGREERRDYLIAHGYEWVNKEKPKPKRKTTRKVEKPPKDLKKLAEDLDEKGDKDED